ncbi:hypothetical protein CMESO_460 (nucleomorph) [Chroomonas mesostigmatica CCMP1168]|uniref:Uncharacterized protein n=1 Tax=Chroomonas mesostigmatica CCMP1168 TaxID=1195612 RepID=J7G3I6_9CRYP|nr:hypothetical protein CMESO_460 [Chroomonas mesostigmatica CCMP1168]
MCSKNIAVEIFINKQYGVSTKNFIKETSKEFCNFKKSIEFKIFRILLEENKRFLKIIGERKIIQLADAKRKKYCLKSSQIIFSEKKTYEIKKEIGKTFLISFKILKKKFFFFFYLIIKIFFLQKKKFFKKKSILSRVKIRIYCFPMML